MVSRDLKQRPTPNANGKLANGGGSGVDRNKPMPSSCKVCWRCDKLDHLRPDCLDPQKKAVTKDQSVQPSAGTSCATGSVLSDTLSDIYTVMTRLFYLGLEDFGLSQHTLVSLLGRGVPSRARKQLEASTPPNYMDIDSQRHIHT